MHARLEVGIKQDATSDPDTSIMQQLQQVLQSLHSSESTSQVSSYRTLLLSPFLYDLNKSRSKFVRVGLSPQLNFTPVIVISGPRSPDIVLNVCDWTLLQQNQGLLFNYFFNTSGDVSSIIVGHITVYFEKCGDIRVVRLEDHTKLFTVLGLESLEGLFKLDPIITQRLNILSERHFGEFYKELIEGIRDLSGDAITNVCTVLRSLQSDNDNSCCMLELLHLLPEKIAIDVKT